MRKRKRDWPVVVYSFGILPRGFLDAMPDWIEEEARKINSMWNRLVEISKQYFEEYRKVVDSDPEVAAIKRNVDKLEAESKELLKRIKELRMKLRTKKAPEIAELEKKRKEIQIKIREEKKILKEARKKVRDKGKKIFEEMDKRMRLEVWNSDLFWGNKEVVLDRFRVAWKKVKEGHFPRFHRFNGNWSLTYRFQQGGMPVEEFQRKFFDRIPSPEDFAVRGRRKRHKRVKVHVVFKQGRGKEVVLPVILHRPLPEGSFVKRAVLVRREHGRDFSKWYYQVVLEVPPEKLVQKPAGERKPIIILEPGFRKVDEVEVKLKMPVFDTESGRWRSIKVVRKADVIRVATLYDGENLREVCLPPKITAKIEAANDKQSKADRIFQELKDDLRRFFLDLVQDAIWVKKLPENLVKMVKVNQVWGRVRKRGMREIIRQLEEKGLFPDIVEEIKVVLNRYDRLINVAVRMKKKALGYRKKFYENLAKELYDKYEVVVWLDIELDRLAEKERAEELVKKARFQRFIAGLSVLRNCLEWKAFKTAGTLEVVQCPGKTKVCHVCGHPVDYPYPERQFWRCEHCGAEWDVDENAVKNLWKKICAGSRETEKSVSVKTAA